MAYLYLEKMSNYKQNESGSLQEMVLSLVSLREAGENQVQMMPMQNTWPGLEK